MKPTVIARLNCAFAVAALLFALATYFRVSRESALAARIRMLEETDREIVRVLAKIVEEIERPK